jgi:hypothetical protein
MYIVADENRFAEYEKKMEYTSFTMLKKEKRVSFLNYSDLEKQYNQVIEQQSMQTIIL